jgi:hypothetical protein
MLTKKRTYLEKDVDLVLLNWHNDGYPPIDLNARVHSVVALIKEVIRLRGENKKLKEQLKESEDNIQEIIYGDKPDCTCGSEDAFHKENCSLIEIENIISNKKEEKKWKTIGSDTKRYLGLFATIKIDDEKDLTNSNLQHLFVEGLIGKSSEFTDRKCRKQVKEYCITDLGIETAKHYFPGIKNI